MKTNAIKTLLMCLLLALTVGMVTSCGSDNEPALPENPEINFTHGGVNQTVNAEACELECRFTSNLKSSQLRARSSESWCTVSIDEMGKNSQNMSSYRLKVAVEENAGGSKRSTVVVIASTDGSLENSFMIEQKASEMVLSKTSLGFDKNAANVTVQVTTRSAWSARCNADWCHVEKIGNYLKVAVTSTTVDREAVITFDNRAETIRVRQTKWAVGEEYSEGGATGTVAYIGDDKRFIYRFVSGSYSWSGGRQIQTGASSETDGYSNTEKVKSISGWRTTFPAFAAVDALNTGGVSGWYLPAVGELDLMLTFIEKHFSDMGPYKRVHSSTEGDVTNGGFPNGSCYLYIDYNNGSWHRYTGLKMDSGGFSVFAIRQF